MVFIRVSFKYGPLGGKPDSADVKACSVVWEVFQVYYS